MMQDATRGLPTALERLHALGMAYVRFAVETPLIYRVATGAVSRRGTKYVGCCQRRYARLVVLAPSFNHGSPV